MTGLIYKEWKQNRWFILSMILCGSFPLMVCLFFSGQIHDADNLSTCLMSSTVGAFLAAGALQMLVVGGDDRKLWGYFISSSPEGYRGFLRIKYEMVFAMEVLFLITIQYADALSCAAAADIGIEGTQEAEQLAESTAMILAFVQILFRAIDIPFVYRFGAKKGSVIKMICFVSLVILLTGVCILKIDDLDIVSDRIMAALNGEQSSFLLPVVFLAVLAAYIVSWFVTCRLYLKGVEQYDK